MTETTPALQSLRMVRRFDAAPEQVFDAWTDPDRAAKWLFTGPDSEAHSTTFDLRIGGQWEVVDRRGGTDYRAIGEYLEILRPRRLAFTFGMPQFSPGFSKVIVEIAPDGVGAVMTMTHEDVPAESVTGLEQGWHWMFVGLAERLRQA
jgi:uncharacterized protein YndB with AHSA1/START domain